MRSIDRKGRLKLSFRQELYFKIEGEMIDQQIRAKSQPQKGIRQTILEAYIRGGREEALKQLDIINKKFGKIVYTVGMMDNWIKESKFVVKSGGRSDDEDAR